MKFRQALPLLALLFATWLQAGAQHTPPVNEPDYNKPKVFADLPDRMPFKATDADALLNLPVGATVNALLAPGFLLKGTVVSKSKAGDAQVQSVVVKGTGRGGAVLTVSRIKNNDGSFVYRGRMLGQTAGDALEIAKEGNTYVLRKKGYYDLVNE